MLIAFHLFAILVLYVQVAAAGLMQRAEFKQHLDCPQSQQCKDFCCDSGETCFQEVGECVKITLAESPEKWQYHGKNKFPFKDSEECSDGVCGGKLVSPILNNKMSCRNKEDHHTGNGVKLLNHQSNLEYATGNQNDVTSCPDQTFKQSCSRWEHCRNGCNQSCGNVGCAPFQVQCRPEVPECFCRCSGVS